MKLLIDDHDGLGLQDYSAHFDAEHPPKLKRRLNRAAAMQAWLATADSAFRVPTAGARVVLQREDGYKLFTGYLAAAPLRQYLGATQSGAAWRYELAAIDDSWLLDRNGVPARTPFVYRTAGDALRTLTNDVLPNAFDVSGVAELDHVNQFILNPQKSWSEHAQELATMTRACYRAHDGKLTLQPVGQQGFTISEQDPLFSPEGLLAVESDLLRNDVTILGTLEPTLYCRDYFLGDNTTLGFYLAHPAFSRQTVTVFEEEYLGPALDTTLWYSGDAGGHVTVSGGQLHVNGGPATVGLAEPVELAGGVRLQHGQVTFNTASTGTLGGVYNGAVADANCIAGFRIAPSGANCSIQAVISGTPAGNALTTTPGHVYEFSTLLFANEARRVHQTYCSSAQGGGNGRGGDAIPAAMRVVLSVHDVDPNSPGTLAQPATVLYDGVLAPVPPFAAYAVLNGTDLHVAVSFTRLQQMVNAEVRSMPPGQSFRTRLAGALADGGECYVTSAGQLRFYPPYPPQANEQIVISYRGSGRAIARVQDPNSIASHNVGYDAGRRSLVKRAKVPEAPTSVDCERLALALLDDTVQAAWSGEYRVMSEALPAKDAWPGDAVQVSAASRGATFVAIVRQVEIDVTSLERDRAQYRVSFANDAAALLAFEFNSGTLPEPLPPVFTASGPSSSRYLPALTAAQVTGAIATQITVDAGTPPPPGGGLEVRRSDGGWGASSDGNLVGRYATQSFVLPRLSRVQDYYLRQYDGSSPAKYSRYSAALHVDYPLQ